MLLGDFPLSLTMPEERARVTETLKQALEHRSVIQDFEFRAVRRDGHPFWASVSWQPIYDANNHYLGLRASIRDNTELKEDRLALRKAVIELRQIQSLGQSYLSRAESERARLTALLAAMRFGVLFVDNDNRVVFHNPAFCDLWGLSPNNQLAGKPIGQILQIAENRPALGDIIANYLEELALSEDKVDFGELTMNDSRVITQHGFRVLDSQGAANGRMWIYEDVTQQRELSAHMIKLAERDSLTGLYNRHRFQQELDRMVSEADRRQSAMALVFFDLDEFKHVNDTFGHGVGDELLKSIAKTIGTQVRRHEVFSRLGAMNLPSWCRTVMNLKSANWPSGLSAPFRKFHLPWKAMCCALLLPSAWPCSPIMPATRWNWWPMPIRPCIRLNRPVNPPGGCTGRMRIRPDRPLTAFPGKTGLPMLWKTTGWSCITRVFIILKPANWRIWKRWCE